MAPASVWLSKAIREKFPDGVESLSAVSQAELLKLLLARAEYQGPQGAQGRQGIQGEKGETGSPPAHEWDGTRIRFQNPDGTWGAWVDLVGEEPAHEWEGSKLRFQNPDSTWGEWIDLLGPTGPLPEHQWLGTKLRFKLPDGTWGEWKDIGGKQGKDGPQGLPGKDGKDGKDGKPGPRGEKGTPGKAGKDGKDGDVGPMPKHEWQGRKLRFQLPNGSWGPWVDLEGRPGFVQYLRDPNSGGGGSGSDFLTKVAAEDISALKVVYVFSPTQVKVGSPSTYSEAQALGVAITAGNTGQEIRVQTEGELSDASFTFPLNAPLFLGALGAITDVPPAVGNHTRIGYSMGAGKIFLKIEESIII